LADALLATTSSGDADVLVTGDAALLVKARKAGVKCEVWDLADFKAFVADAVGH
jgi:predicted nucleic acid-binding protein